MRMHRMHRIGERAGMGSPRGTAIRVVRLACPFAARPFFARLQRLCTAAGLPSLQQQRADGDDRERVACPAGRVTLAGALPRRSRQPSARGKKLCIFGVRFVNFNSNFLLNL